MNMNLKLRVPHFQLKPYTVEKPAVTTPCSLVYYDGELASLRALRMACQNATPKTKIIALYLEMVPLTQEPCSKNIDGVTMAQAVLAAAKVNAKTYGCAIETMSRECYARGPALLELAAQYENATIYLGTDPFETDPFADYVQALEPARVVLVPV